MTGVADKAGQFITFEGGEGVGKSTNIRFCAEWLEPQGISVLVTREPGGTEIAEIIREALLKKVHEETMDDMTELLLVFAARAQHIASVIKPALAEGKWVLCDRFTDSTIAYQGYGRGLPLESIHQLKTLAQKGLEPDTTFLLDAPTETGMSRARARGPADRFEVEKSAFFERVRTGFLQLANDNPAIITIDASESLDRVQQQLSAHLEEMLKG